MRDCTCHAPEDAEPEDHDDDCPENPGVYDDYYSDHDLYYGE
jgi:hypothetical protein